MGDYYILLKAFEKNFPELRLASYKEGDALWHIFSHAQHDTYHAQLAQDALNPILIERNSSERALKACLETRDAFDTFWNELYSEIKDSEN